MTSTIAEILATVQELFGKKLETIARETGFVRRQRCLSGASFARMLVFGYLANGEASLAQLSHAAAASGTRISRQGISKRFTPEAAMFMKRVLEHSVQQVIETEPVAIEVLSRFKRVYLRDSSIVQLPEALSEIWSGFGGRTASTSHAAVKLLVQYDLSQGRLEGPMLSAGRMHDLEASKALTELPKGALLLQDLGFFSLRVFATLQEQGVYWMSRYKSGTTILHLSGEAIDLVALLKQQGKQPLDMPVLAGQKKHLACRLVAIAVPEAVAEQRRQRLLAEAEDKQQSVSALSWALAAWTVYLTNVPETLLNWQEVMILTTCRWQIELIFKLWKSHTHIDESHSANPWQFLCELYAKLTAVLIQHWFTLVGCWQLANRSLVQAAHVIQRFALAINALLFQQSALQTLMHALLDTLNSCKMTGNRCKPTFQRLLLLQVDWLS